MPQSVDAIAGTPHPAPHFVVESIPAYLLPPILPLYRQGSADAAATPPCHCKIELSIPLIEEDDPTVVLEARWFIDYDVAVPASTRPWLITDSDLGFDNPATVRGLAAFSFDVDTFGISTNGIHVVTVVLGEKAGFDPTSTTLPNRGMITGFSSDEHAFVVNVRVDQDSSRPQCPSDFLSIRVCQ